MKKDKFFSFIKLADSDADDNDLVQIEMLRVGKFNHPRHGELDITLDFLEKIVGNFNDDVIKREVSFDWNHEQKEASAWLKELEIVEDVLVGGVEFSENGRKSVEDGGYGYFSIEYVDDYVDPEDDVEYGPALTGGALTNRPFITNLKKIEFENSDFEGNLYRLEEAKSMKKKVNREPATVDTKDNKELEDLKVQIKQLQDDLKEKETQLGDTGSIDEKITQLTSTLKKMDESNKELQNEVKSLRGNLNEKDEETRKLKVEAVCEKLLTEGGHHRSVVEVAKEIMLADKTSEKVIKLSETIGEGDDAVVNEIELSICDSIEKLLEAIPKSQRADYSEKTKIVGMKEGDEAEDLGIKRAFARKGIKLASAA